MCAQTEYGMRLLLLASVSIVLAGCGNSTVASPDSNNPAHCLAAFNYYAYWFKVGHEPGKVAEELARGMYVMEQVKAAGISPSEVLAEGKEFTQMHVKNSNEMDALYAACAKSQAYDPRFRAEFRTLIGKAAPLVPKFEAGTTAQ